MKVYLVRRGWDSVDCSPQNIDIYLDKQKAIAFIQQDLQADLRTQGQHEGCQVRIKENGPERWSIEILFDGWSEWVDDEVWLLEEFEVIA